MTSIEHTSSEHRFPRNVPPLERAVSAAGGSALLALGAARRDTVAGKLALLGGTFLVVRGATGFCSARYLLQKRAGAVEGEAVMDHEDGINVERAVTIQKPPAELYAFWRNLENLPRFMRHLESVTAVDGARSHWVAEAPAGTSVAWDAEIINDVPGELIAWKSVESAQVPNAGSVHFTPAPGGRGTEVRVRLRYDPPGGRAGDLLARLFRRDPDHEIARALRDFKQEMETGEIATIEGQPSGRKGE